MPDQRHAAFQATMARMNCDEVLEPMRSAQICESEAERDEKDPREDGRLRFHEMNFTAERFQFADIGTNRKSR